MSFSENPLSNPLTHLILFTNTGCPIYFIYFGVTLTILPFLIYTYTGCFTKKYTQSSKLILKPLTDDTSFFFNYLQFMLYQPLINYQLGFNPICHSALSVTCLPQGQEG